MLKIQDIEGEGYKPLKDYNCWRIAQLGYSKGINSIEKISTFGRHHKTHEVFVLLEGEAFMFTAGCCDCLGVMEVEKLEKNKLYTVTEGQWHAAVLKCGTRLLIIENMDTGDNNSDIHMITEDDRKTMVLLKMSVEQKH